MWPVSANFLNQLTKTHNQLCYLEIIRDGQTVTTLQNGKMIDPNTGNALNTIGGNVVVGPNTIRRTGTVNFVDTSGQLLPETVNDLLAPYVTEVRVWMGVQYDLPFQDLLDVPGQVTSEFCPVATLVVTGLQSEYPQITLTGSDRMWHLSNFTAPYTIPVNTPLDQALAGILSTFVPTSKLNLNLPSTTKTTGATTAMTFDANTSAADAAYTVAAIADWQLIVDPMGTFTVMPMPSTEDAPVMTYSPSTANMYRPKRSLGGGATGTDVYNAVVFTSEGGANGAVYRGYAEDDDPNSLTFVGRIGVRPYFESSPLITSQDQANQAAETRLQSILGVTDTIAVPVMPNFALDSGDVIHVTDSTQQIDLNLIVDSFTVPLRATDGVQELQCRSRVIR